MWTLPRLFSLPKQPGPDQIETLISVLIEQNTLLRKQLEVHGIQMPKGIIKPLTPVRKRGPEDVHVVTRDDLWRAEQEAQLLLDKPHLQTPKRESPSEDSDAMTDSPLASTTPTP
jgi:hypothetical protein